MDDASRTERSPDSRLANRAIQSEWRREKGDALTGLNKTALTVAPDADPLLGAERAATHGVLADGSCSEGEVHSPRVHDATPRLYHRSCGVVVYQAHADTTAVKSPPVTFKRPFCGAA